MNEIYEQIKKISSENNGSGAHLLASYEALYSKKIPLIFDIYSCSQIMNIDAYFINSLFQDTSKMYRYFKIPKKNGQDRMIEAPLPKLLQCQKWICLHILNKVHLHDAATAYREKRDILHNTQIHLGKKHLLKLDLKDFFHSIKIERVITVFKKLGYVQNVALILAKFCCHQNRLSQGSATSPTLSNIIAERLDKRLNGLANKYKLDYTRYSDDITFSGDYIQKNIIKVIDKIIRNEGFSINEKKTRLYIKNGKRIITGISVSEKIAKIPRDKKRLIKQEVYEVLKRNNMQTTISDTKKDVFFLESLKGKLHFWRHIEKDATYPKKALEAIKNIENSIPTI